MGLVIDTKDFVAFSARLRATSPELGRRLQRNLRLAARQIVAKMRSECPHPSSGARRGIRYSTSFSAKGAAIEVGGSSAPQTYAYAFGVGQKRTPGKYKHPVWGKWSSSPNTVMDSSLFVVKAWEEGKRDYREAARAAVIETIDLLAEGSAL